MSVKKHAESIGIHKLSLKGRGSNSTIVAKNAPKVAIKGLKKNKLIMIETIKKDALPSRLLLKILCLPYCIPIKAEVESPNIKYPIEQITTFLFGNKAIVISEPKSNQKIPEGLENSPLRWIPENKLRIFKLKFGR